MALLRRRPLRKGVGAARIGFAASGRIGGRLRPPSCRHPAAHRRSAANGRWDRQPHERSDYRCRDPPRQPSHRPGNHVGPIHRHPGRERQRLAQRLEVAGQQRVEQPSRCQQERRKQGTDELDVLPAVSLDGNDGFGYTPRVRILALEWDDDTVEHLAKHGVHPEEAAQACRGRPYVLRTRGGRYLVLGQSGSGRYLTVIVESLGGGNAKIVTARDMTEHERRAYLRR